MATILFVDDDDTECHLAREVLETAGYDVLCAGDGEAGLEAFGSQHVDVVVTDLAMPRLNGLRLILQLRKLDRGVKIVAISGVYADHLMLAEELGAITVLEKPWDPGVLLEAIAHCCEAGPDPGHSGDAPATP